ncbi:hypothetical protein Tco_1007026 [Tanacetum coccineum]|uniref:Uncharacterized protein n=1 Tax=Tanacetum coccineum TaxID=301880 RepID=A0ABQ5FJJ0_9ASTR
MAAIGSKVGVMESRGVVVWYETRIDNNFCEQLDFMPCGYNIDKTSCGGEACHLDEQNPKCLENWENLDFQDLVVDGWVDGNGSNPSDGFGKPGGGQETLGGGDRLERHDGQLSMV